MANALDPAFVQLNYHSQYGVHTATIPTLQWNSVASAGNAGQFETWGASDIDAKEMVEDLIDLMEPFYPTDVEYDGFTIFTMASAVAPALPVAGGILTNVGTQAVPGFTQAVQTTIGWRTATFGLFKIVMLDSASGDDFSIIRNPSVDVSLLALHNYMIGNTHGWSGRDNARPTQFIKCTQTLNEKLRRSYRQT